MEQINSQLIQSNIEIPYRYDQNSNSYATSLLAAVGINVMQYQQAVMPPYVEGDFGLGEFPGIGVDVLQNRDTTIDFELEGSDRTDIIRTGAGNDSIDGGGGNDLILGGAGNDTLWGGGGGYDNVIGGEGNDVLESLGEAGFLDGGEGFDIYRLTGMYATPDSPFTNVEVISNPDSTVTTHSDFPLRNTDLLQMITDVDRCGIGIRQR